MKKVRLQVPMNLLDSFLNYLIEKQFNVVVSWATEQDFFSPQKLVVIIAVTDAEFLDITTGTYKAYVTK